MKKILFIVTVLLGLNAGAQSFQLGVKIGLTNTQIIGSDFQNFEVPSSSNGFLIGAFSRVGLVGFFIQPEISFRNLEFTIKKDGTTNPSESVSKLNYIDVPILFGKKFFNLLYVSGGPNFQFLVNENLSATNAGSLGPGNYNDFVVGAQLGIGIDIPKFCFDIRYDFSINPIGNTATLINNSQNVDFSSRASMFQFTIGYKFISL